jgi:hypothetical protein
MTSFLHRLKRIAMPLRGAGALSFGWPFVRNAVLWLALLSVLSVSMAQGSAAGAAPASEERVKAASLYRFLSYVDWPPAAFLAAASPYVVGVVSADDIADELLRISAGRSLNNHPVAIRKMQAGDPLAGLHALFIGKPERSRQRQLLRQAQGLPILLVTESEGALAQGSMINFRVVDDRVRFEVSLDPAEKSGLKLNSRMLAIAISVMKEPPQ